MTSLYTMSVWLIAIGLELGLADDLQGRRIRFLCTHCLGVADPRREHPAQDAPYAAECMECPNETREPILSVILPAIGEI